MNEDWVLVKVVYYTNSCVIVDKHIGQTPAPVVNVDFPVWTYLSNIIFSSINLILLIILPIIGALTYRFIRRRLERFLDPEGEHLLAVLPEGHVVAQVRQALQGWNPLAR